jgi:hypothetical protein
MKKSETAIYTGILVAILFTPLLGIPISIIGAILTDRHTSSTTKGESDSSDIIGEQKK